MPHHKGIHHITVLAGDPQLNAEFYVKTLGMRMVKKCEDVYKKII